MPPSRFTCGIVVPVRDEAHVLPKTVPALLAAVEGERVRLVWVCNGCSDRSAEVIRRLAGKEGEVIEIASPGKSLALQAGDEALGVESLFPRLYLDADTWLRPGDVRRLLKPLREGRADLVAASHAFDNSKASFVSAEMARCWLALPFARSGAFLGAVAVSSVGRAHWGEWPLVIADDTFMMGVVPTERQMMVPDAVATTWPPRAFSGWVSMRARWLRGERQLVEMGLTLPSKPSQRRVLAKRLVHPRTSLGAWAFCFARLLAVPQSRLPAGISWTPAREAQ